MNDDDGLTALMYAPTDLAPPTYVDLGRAVRAGRQRRRRRVVVPAAAAVMALGVTVAAVGLAGVGRLRAPLHVADPSASASIPAGPAAPTRFDPLRWRLVVGFVPHGLTQDALVLGETEQTVGFADPGHVTIVQVSQYPAGLQPPRLLQMGTVSDAPPLHGQKAVWHRNDRGVVDGLGWRWAPDAWAVVMSTGVDLLAGGEASLRQVAESARFDGNEPLRLPFTITPVQGIHLLQTGHGSTAYGLWFGVDGVEFSPSSTQTSVAGPAVMGGAPQVIVNVIWKDPQQQDRAPNAVRGGYQAVVVSQPDTYLVTLYGVAGYQVSVTIHGAALTRVSPEQADAMALSVTPLGPPNDTTQWTDMPIR
jgi:hypothetical protein